MLYQHRISLFKMCVHVCAVTLFSSKVAGTAEIGKCLCINKSVISDIKRFL